MNSRKGFTFVETLVTIGVLVMLTSVLFLYNRGSEQQLVLVREKAKLIDMLLRAKSSSINTLVSEEPVCGYGVHWLSDSYLLFKDVSPNCLNLDHQYLYTENDDQKIIVEKINLPGGYSLVSTGAQNDIFFLPPDPKVFFDGADSQLSQEATLSLFNADNTLSTSVKLNNAGQISAQ